MVALVQANQAIPMAYGIYILLNPSRRCNKAAGGITIITYPVGCILIYSTNVITYLVWLTLPQVQMYGYLVKKTLIEGEANGQWIPGHWKEELHP
jgi:hypothetical protein